MQKSINLFDGRKNDDVLLSFKHLKFESIEKTSTKRIEKKNLLKKSVISNA